MTTSVLAHRGRAALTATMTVAAFSLFPPPAQAVGTPLTLEGGDATAKMVCGNVADAQALADSQHLTIQRNSCHPKATGGDIELHDVDITIRAAAVHASEDNESLAALAVAGGAATAETTCTNAALAAAPRAVVRNHCWSRARGGRLELRDVTFVSHKANGETRKAVRSLFLRGTNGRVGSGCADKTPAGRDSRDDCVAEGVGGAIDLRSVDLKNAAGATSSNMRVLVRGGNANAAVYCFNYLKATTQARQANTCSSTAQGGNATLRNVTIHVYS
jgi:hypothetical protein